MYIMCIVCLGYLSFLPTSALASGYAHVFPCVYLLNHSIGYHDCETFGVVKKGKFFSASDFNFKLVAEVICENLSSSGYLVKLTPTGSNVTR